MNLLVYLKLAAYQLGYTDTHPGKHGRHNNDKIPAGRSTPTSPGPLFKITHGEMMNQTPITANTLSCQGCLPTIIFADNAFA